MWGVVRISHPSCSRPEVASRGLCRKATPLTPPSNRDSLAPRSGKLDAPLPTPPLSVENMMMELSYSPDLFRAATSLPTPASRACQHSSQLGVMFRLHSPILSPPSLWLARHLSLYFGKFSSCRTGPSCAEISPQGLQIDLKCKYLKS